LGEQLTALYSYGGLSACTYCTARQGINLFIIIRDDTRMQDVREALHQVWLLHGDKLGQVPLVARRASFLRHLRLDPVLAYDLMATGEKHAGEDLVGRRVIPEHIELVARIAKESMKASSALAPTMISRYEYNVSVNTMRCLANQYVADDYSPDDHPSRIYAGIQKYVAIQIGRYDGLKIDPNNEPGNAPVLEVLLAVYSMDNRLILVLPDLPPDDIAEKIATIDWATVANRISGEFRGLRLTTPSQLRLIMQIEGAADVSLGIIERLWGKDLLHELEIERWRVMRDLTKLPSDILIDTLPRSLIVSEDNDLPVLVHDLQNRLLNIQLRNELFSRLEYSARKMPPEPLPDRSAPSLVRIEAITDQLEWWANYYFREMDEVLTKGS
jgi:hypothetical protein